MKKLWQKKITLRSFQKKNTLPATPGVYFFLDEKDVMLYIGKATALRDRVRSYFLQDMLETRGPKVQRMMERIATIAYRETDSMLEALILEAKLIKVKQPLYNTDQKDDKSYNYVVITKERFPRVLIVRGRNVVKGERFINKNKQEQPYKYIFGPYPFGGGLREALKIVRRLFPYRDNCVPAEVLVKKSKQRETQQRTRSKKHNKNSGQQPCFSAQIGLCPGVCAGLISAREYGRIMNHIRLFFEGHKQALVTELKREMKLASKDLNFERAGAIKKTLFGLQHISDMALIKDDTHLTLNDQQKTLRIEAYDVAHFAGAASVGVMVTLENGRPAKAGYRKFILRGNHTGNDLSALGEILTRRLKHNEWPLPELIVIDGSFPQLETAEETLRADGITIPVVGVVKNAQHQPERLIGADALTKRFKKEVLLANSEAHRFALTFHRKRRGKEFLGK